MNAPTKRAELAHLVPTGGTIIELGVAAGKFAVELLNADPTVQYLGIDRWSDHHDDREMEEAAAALSIFPGRAILLRSTFDDAIGDFLPNSVDMIYVDGYAHTGQESGKTLEDWWPIVKDGGIFAGHDYHPKWQPTITAVDAFVKRHDLKLNIIHEQPFPSWWVRK
jgi:hypothetical protein